MVEISACDVGTLSRTACSLDRVLALCTHSLVAA